MRPVVTIHRLVITALVGLAASSCSSAPTAPAPKPDAGRAEGTGGGLLCTSYAETADKPAPSGDAPLVLRVVLRGMEQRREMCDLMSTRAGGRLDPATIERDMREIWRTGFVDDVWVAKEPAPGGVLLAFETKPRKEVTRVALDGAPKEAASELEELLPGAGFVDPARDWKIARSLSDALRSHGYRRASVAYRVVDEPTGEATLRFTVTAGTPVLIGKVELTGLSVLDASKLSAGFYTRPGAAVAEDALARDALVIASAGYDAGLLDLRVDPAQVVDDADGRSVTVTWRVTEGPVFRVGKVVYQGDLRGTSDEYLKLSRAPKKGDVFRRSDFAAAIAAVTSFHTSKGETVTVDPQSSVDNDRHVVDLTLVVTRTP